MLKAVGFTALTILFAVSGGAVVFFWDSLVFSWTSGVAWVVVISMALYSVAISGNVAVEEWIKFKQGSR